MSKSMQVLVQRAMASQKPGKLGHSLSRVDCLVEFTAMFGIRLTSDPAELSCVVLGLRLRLGLRLWL